MTCLDSAPTAKAMTGLNKLVGELHTTSDLFTISDFLADRLSTSKEGGSIDVNVFTSLIEVLHQRHKAHAAAAITVTYTLEQCTQN